MAAWVRPRRAVAMAVAVLAAVACVRLLLLSPPASDAGRDVEGGAQKPAAAEGSVRAVQHARNAVEPALAGRRKWSVDAPQDRVGYDGPSDPMQRNAFNEQVSNKLPSNRAIPDTREHGYDAPLSADWHGGLRRTVPSPRV
jgi:hypothetical protein